MQRSACGVSVNVSVCPQQCSLKGFLGAVFVLFPVLQVLVTGIFSILLFFEFPSFDCIILKYVTFFSEVYWNE